MGTPLAERRDLEGAQTRLTPPALSLDRARTSVKPKRAARAARLWKFD